MGSEYIVLFAIIFTGYFARKIELIDSNMNDSINRFVIYFTFPCLILDVMDRSNLDRELMLKFFTSFALSISFFAIYSLVAYLYSKVRKLDPKDSNVSEFSMVAPNNGFIGFPVAIAFLGNTGLLYMITSSITLNLYIFSYGTFLLMRNSEKKAFSLSHGMRRLIKFFKNPNIIAVILGITFAVINFKLPEVFSSYFHTIGMLSTPLSMILIGSSLAENKFFNIIKDRLAVEVSFMKLLIMPALTLLIVLALPFDKEILAIMVTAAAMPTGATVFMMTQHRKQNYVLASNSILLSTIFSIVTIPLWIEFIGYVLL